MRSGTIQPQQRYTVYMIQQSQWSYNNIVMEEVILMLNLMFKTAHSEHLKEPLISYRRVQA